jgi:hypothetical protein
MKIVFLDIDGVLNCRDQWTEIPSLSGRRHDGLKIDPVAVSRLNKIAIGCSVVVSSSWRFNFTPEELRIELLRFGLDPTIPFIDRTSLADRPQRGDEIRDWLDEHLDVASFVVLDDDNDMDAVRHRFVKTSWANGLEDKHIPLALDMLDLRKDLL